MFGCASSPQLSANRFTSLPNIEGAEQTWNHLAKAADQGNTNLLRDHLSYESQLWIEAMASAAQFEDSLSLQKRPFYEILSITGLRYLYSSGQISSLSPEGFTEVLFHKKNFLNKGLRSRKLAPFELRDQFAVRGTLAAPQVPVVYMVYEEGAWMLDLTRTLPIISRGVGSVGAGKDWTEAQKIRFILESAFKTQVSESELFRAP
jgi:hypothetical protein